MTPADPLTTPRIVRFWLPLAGTWLMMAVEGPFLAAVIARLPDPAYNLAAYGVAYALALLVEGPVIMMMSASTALVRDRVTYLRLRNFTNWLNLVLTGLMVVLLLPPVFRFVTGSLLDLDPEVARRTWVAVALLLPWPGTIGYRRFYQGLLIRSGRTRLVAAGTVLRLAAMGATGLVLAMRGGVGGAAVGAAALSAGVIVEAAASRVMAHRTVAELLEREPQLTSLSFPEIASFYWPLALTSTLSLGIQPVVTFFMSHARAPLESLAVLPVVMALVFLFRSLGLAAQEVFIALAGDAGEGLPALRRFAVGLGVATAGALAVIAWTPLADLWFRGVSGLEPALADFARLPARILAPIPALTVLLSWQRARCVSSRVTRPVTVATTFEVVGVVAVLALTVAVLDWVGAAAAATALVCGRLAANGYLATRVARLDTGTRA
jgi:hypothetical protein